MKKVKTGSLYQNIILAILCLAIVAIAVIQFLQFRKNPTVQIKGEYQINCEEKADSSTLPFLSGENTKYSGKQNCTIKQK